MLKDWARVRSAARGERGARRMIDVLNWFAANPALGTILAIVAGLTICGVVDGLGNIGRGRG